MILSFGITSIFEIPTNACSMKTALDGINIASNGMCTITYRVFIRIQRLLSEKPISKVKIMLAVIDPVRMVLADSDAEMSN